MGNKDYVVNPANGKLQRIDLFTGEITDLKTPESVFRREPVPFDTDMALDFLEKLREGKSVKDSLSLSGVKDMKTLHSWRRRYPDFAKRFEEALEDRAYYFEDKMVSLANDPGNIVESKFKFDSYEKLAKVSNRKRYGDKVEASGVGAVTFVIQTGLPEKVVEVVDGRVSEEGPDSERGDESGGDSDYAGEE